MVIRREQIETIRRICADASRNKHPDVIAALETLMVDPDWERIQVSLILLSRYALGRALGPSSSYAMLRSYVATIHPTFSRFADCTLEGLQLRVDRILEIDSKGSASNEELDESAAVYACILCFVALDPWDNEEWERIEEFLEEASSV
ncbi:hypothetical protein [Gordonia sp. MP11Mi]|uniref:hypothetical protein n=1 Tax=Gordonia sp. MP11Mi TaxID=3022769 RepID=UPI003B225CD6